MQMNSISDWLLAPATRALTPAALIEGVAEELQRRGIPVARISTSALTKHPEVMLLNMRWSARSGTEVNHRRHDYFATAEYLESPVAAIRAGTDRNRCRVDSREAEQYPQLLALRAEGLTDYAAFALAFGEGMRSFISFATGAPEGFGDAEFAMLEGMIDAFGLRLELASARHAVRSLLEVYLGNNAAARVLAGAFRRGSGVSIRAAIWFSDMRDFTRFADTHSAERVAGELDRVFEAVAAPIASHGGEVLKFIGDGVMAVFPVDADVRDACTRALTTAEEALVRVAALKPSDADAEAPKIGIALHLGEVFYGNIGASDRLDFTVIGAAVNETCRVESLTKRLGANLLLTAAFAAQLPSRELRSLGVHDLKGVATPLEVFTTAR